MENLIGIINENISFIVIALLVITVLLFIIVISLIVSTNKLKKRYRRLMRGITNKNLEELIISKMDDVYEAKAKANEAIKHCEETREVIKGCVNKVAIMRYKAFEDVGSDLSYSIAILDSYNDGVLLTGIYTRHDSVTYAKPVDKGISRYELSEEEKYVLDEAINKK